jgi:hypothetical protein
MKAEHRKELEANTLAEKMGRVVETVKAGQRRTYVTYLVVLAGILIAAFLGYRWWTNKKVVASSQWVEFYDGNRSSIEKLAQEKDTTVGKAARLQFAWFVYWDYGVKMMRRDPDGAVAAIHVAEKTYSELIDECKDDSSPLFKLQAMLGRAVAVETLAVQDRNRLKSAKDFYQEIVTEFDKKDYAEVKFAQQRLDILNDKTKDAELRNTYQELQKMLGVAAPRALKDGMPDLPKKKL